MKSIFIAIFSIFLIGTASAQTEKMESIFIYNFISKYIEWPASYKTGDFVIGVLGNSPIKTEFSTMAASKKVGAQKIVVKKFASTSDVTKCHVLYVPSSKKGQLSAAKTKIGSNSTLIVSSFSGGAKGGASINFVTIGGKLKFELNPANAKKQSLKISSALSSLAIIVN